MKNPIVELMEQKDWKYGELAAAAGVSYSTVYKHIKGISAEVNNDILLLAEYLGKDKQEFNQNYKQFKAKNRDKLLK